MGVKLVSSSGGSVEINPPTTASNFTATMPAGTGNVVVNGVNGALVAGTAVASTSGTSIDFTSIPSWVRRITVMFSGVSTSGSSNYLVQIGTGGTPTTTGYTSVASRVWATNQTNTYTSTSGFIFGNDLSTYAWSGSIVLTNITGNTWVVSALIGSVTGTTLTNQTVGTVTLGGVLNIVRTTTVNGTDTFDAGSINILYE